MKREKITVRFVFERDFELRYKDGEDGMSWLSVGDALVQSGYPPYDCLTHENIFEHPVGGFRPVTGHWHDANLYNLTGGQGPLLSVMGRYTSSWLEEGQSDPLYSFDDDEEKPQ